MKARSLLLTAPHKLEWFEEDLPDLLENQLLIKTDYTAVSIGTELPTYLGTSRYFNHQYPTMTGYESLGRIIAVGSEVPRFELNDRVVTFYGHRTYAVIDASHVIKVPPHISDKIALLSILSCDVAKGIRKRVVKTDQSVLVSGAGAIGLLAIFVLRAYGVQNVDVTEPKGERHERALSLGARHVYSTENLLTESYAYALECSGHNTAFQALQKHMHHDGVICVLADGHLEPYTLLPEFHNKELTIVGSSDGWDYQHHAAWFFSLEQEALQKLEGLFELLITAEKLPVTFEKLAKQEISPVKILVGFE